MARKYGWNYRGIRADAAKTFALFEKIREAEGGRLTPDAVVEAARKPRSPIHREFEWSDKKAAREHRLEVARKLCRGLRVEVVRKGGTVQVPRRVFVHVDDEEGAFYTTIGEARANLDFQLQVSGMAEQYLLQMKNRLLDLQDQFGIVSGVIVAIEAALQEFSKQQKETG